MTLEALTGLLNAYDERVHLVRGHKGQLQVAKTSACSPKARNRFPTARTTACRMSYSLRCIHRYIGAIRDALDYVKDKIEIELNAVSTTRCSSRMTEAVISGGNFHGEPMALAFDLYGHCLLGNRRHLRTPQPSAWSTQLFPTV